MNVHYTPNYHIRFYWPTRAHTHYLGRVSIGNMLTEAQAVKIASQLIDELCAGLAKAQINKRKEELIKLA